MAGLTRNAAGSPTYRYYDDLRIANEVSAGSCLVKPTHFDTRCCGTAPTGELHRNARHQIHRAHPPARTRVRRRLAAAWNPNSRKTVFIHGVLAGDRSTPARP
ncbi:MAG: hypothetical protein R3C04_08485 [Hyphomonas sp.]